MGHIVCNLEQPGFSATCEEWNICKVSDYSTPLGSNVPKALYPNLVTLLESVLINHQQTALSILLRVITALEKHVKPAADLLRCYLHGSSPYVS